MTEHDRKNDMVGLLEMSLYGTRDAATNWQEEVAKEMKRWGFKRGVYNPCLYRHPEWKIRTLVHGDDFVSTGGRQAMKLFREVLEKRFEIKTKVVGAAEEEVREARVLNRVLRITEQGWEYEPDQRHAEIIIDSMGMQEAKGVSTPGEDERRFEEEENDKPLGSEDATQYRKVAARANYLSADRPDIMFAVQEICREMANPTIGGKRKLKRLARYLRGHQRTVIKYDWQGQEMMVEGYSDSDWAGCRRSGKSTSGGVLRIGEHFLKGWSRTQNRVTLSSAEAKLVALCTSAPLTRLSTTSTSLLTM